MGERDWFQGGGGGDGGASPFFSLTGSENVLSRHSIDKLLMLSRLAFFGNLICQVSALSSFRHVPLFIVDLQGGPEAEDCNDPPDFSFFFFRSLFLPLPSSESATDWVIRQLRIGSNNSSRLSLLSLLRVFSLVREKLGTAACFNRLTQLTSCHAVDERVERGDRRLERNTL